MGHQNHEKYRGYLAGSSKMTTLWIRSPNACTLRNLSFPAAVVKIVQLSVHLSTALVVRFGISISNGHKQRHSCQSFPRHWTYSGSRRRMLGLLCRKCIISSPKALLHKFWETCLLSCNCKIVQLSVHLSTALVVRFGISISNGHKQRHSCQSFPRHWTYSGSRRRML